MSDFDELPPDIDFVDAPAFALHLGDCVQVMNLLGAESVSSVVTDPPYHLTSGGKAGFMGKEWDGGDVAFRVETWAAAFRLLKPGGHLVAFSGTRTYHRMVCAIEDAGFEIRDQLAWVYGTGFPKSSNQDGEWDGWGTALKPAWEPIVLARKPLIGTVPANLAAHRTGALNIDGCRVDLEGETTVRARGDSTETATGWKSVKRSPVGGSDVGRWPANLCHDGSDEVLAGFPDSAGQCGDLKRQEEPSPSHGIYHPMPARGPFLKRKDSDISSARFFYCAKASKTDREAGLAEAGLAEAGLAEAVTTDGRTKPVDNAYLRGETKRLNTHPTVKPTDLMRWLCRLVTPPGGTVLDPFMGSGSTGRAATIEGFEFIGIEREKEYMTIAKARIEAAKGETNRA